jgi:hypothetical protein
MYPLSPQRTRGAFDLVRREVRFRGYDEVVPVRLSSIR